MENTNNQGIELSKHGNNKATVDALAMEVLKKGIMATAFASFWPAAFMGIVFGSQTAKLAKDFIDLEGELYYCAKVGSILGRVGKILGIVMTCFVAFYILYMIFILVVVGAGAGIGFFSEVFN